MVTLLAIVVVFGVHSFVDWTWFVPGNAVLALLCAGWLVGRGPTDEPIVRLKPAACDRARAVADRAGGGRRRRRGGGRLDVVAAPARGRRGLRCAQHRRGAALREARAQIAQAERTNPLSVDLLFQQAAIERAGGNTAGARAPAGGGAQGAREPGHLAGARRVRAQRGSKPQALSAVGSALYLDPRPRSQEAITTYLQASGRQP